MGVLQAYSQTGNSLSREELIDLAFPRIRTYLEHYGPDGEFNECPSYAASSSFPVLFFFLH